MSLKYFLIDEKKYNSLLKSYDPEHLNIAFKDLKNVLSRKDLNISEKNAMYNNNLKGFLKKLKLTAEAPVNVKLENDPVSEETLEQLSELLRQQVSPTITNTLSKLVTPPRSLKRSTSDVNLPTPSAPKKIAPFISNNAIPTPSPRKRRANKEEVKSVKIRQVADHMIENRKKFNLNETGQVLDPQTNKIIPNSNVAEIARHVIEGAPGNSSPAGYKKVKQALNKDPKVNTIRFNIAKWT